VFSRLFRLLLSPTEHSRGHPRGRTVS
jgi:hypothetical protein